MLIRSRNGRREALRAGDHDPWIMRPFPRPEARLRLICLPAAGGGPSLFRAWPEGFPREVEVCLVQLPGRERRFGEPLITRLDVLLEQLVPVLQPWLDRPLAMFGHSMGALISFELARWLRAAAVESPVHLFVSGFPAPQVPRASRALHTLPDAELIERLRRMNGLPASVCADQELLQLVLPVLRADMALVESYDYAEEAPLPCPISAFGGEDDPSVTREALAGWQEQTSGSFTAAMFPGHHFFLFGASEALLLRAISEALQRHLYALAQGSPLVVGCQPDIKEASFESL